MKSLVESLNIYIAYVHILNFINETINSPPYTPLCDEYDFVTFIKLKIISHEKFVIEFNTYNAFTRSSFSSRNCNVEVDLTRTFDHIVVLNLDGECILILDPLN